MRVFKPKRKTAAGKHQAYELWYVEFRDHLPKIRRLPGYTDRKQTETLGRNVERLVCCRSNRETPDLALSQWLESIPRRIQEVLARWDLLAASKMAAGKPLGEHVDDFEGALRAKGNTAKHSEQSAGRVRALFDGCGFQMFADVQALKAQHFLASLRTASEDKDAVTNLTSNYYLQAAKQFCRWMVRENRATHNPLDHLENVTPQTDRKRERRALSVDELRRLLVAAAGGPDRHGIPGRERALIYHLAAESGLRANELRSLIRSSFRFGAKVATVVVEAGSSKRRRRDELPLRPDTAAELQAHLASKHPGANAFSMPRENDTAEMARLDLAAARAAWLGETKIPDERAARERSTFLCEVDEQGRVFDFHGLRHTFLTNPARSGVHPKLAQQLARHSTIVLTMDRYSHVTLGEQSEALAMLPDLSEAFAQEQRATGTEGNRVAFYVAPHDATQCNSVQGSAVDGSNTYVDTETRSAPETAGNAVISRGVKGKGAGGSRTHGGGFAIRCLSLLATAPCLP